MKRNRGQLQKKNIRFNNSKQLGTRNELDNRKNEEPNYRGDDVTHNAKYVYNHPKKIITHEQIKTKTDR